MGKPSVPRLGLSALLVFAGLCIVASAAAFASPAEVPREVHGRADAFVLPGVRIVWGVLQGMSESATVVVVRIVTDPASYPWVAVAGVDPFTHRKQPLLGATRSAGVADVRLPRAHFADFPRTELLFYESAAAAQQDQPAIFVYFLGVPDTTPEYPSEDKLQSSLGDRASRLTNGTSSNAP